MAGADEPGGRRKPPAHPVDPGCWAWTKAFLLYMLAGIVCAMALVAVLHSVGLGGGVDDEALVWQQKAGNTLDTRGGWEGLWDKPDGYVTNGTVSGCTFEGCQLTGFVRAVGNDSNRWETIWKGPYSSMFKGVPGKKGKAARPSLLMLDSGVLVAAWSAGGAVVVSRLEEGAREWTRPMEILDDSGTHGTNPEIIAFKEHPMETEAMVGKDGQAITLNGQVRPPGGGGADRLAVVYNQRPQGAPDGASSVGWAKSVDGGRTWGPGERLIAEQGLVLSGKPLHSEGDHDQRGYWLFPITHDRPVRGSHGAAAAATAAILSTEDEGRRWEEVGITATGQRLSSPSFVRAPSQPRRLLAFIPFLAGSDPGNVSMAFSDDEGRIWSATFDTPLPSNGRRLAVFPSPSGALIAVFANGHPADGWEPPLSIGLSLDEGHTWPFVRDLEGSAGCCGGPAVAVSRHGIVHVAYEFSGGGFKGAAIKHVMLSEGWIMSPFGTTKGRLRGMGVAPSLAYRARAESRETRWRAQPAGTPRPKLEHLGFKSTPDYPKVGLTLEWYHEADRLRAEEETKEKEDDRLARARGEARPEWKVHHEVRGPDGELLKHGRHTREAHSYRAVGFEQGGGRSVYEGRNRGRRLLKA